MGKNIFNAFYKEYLTRAEKALGEMGRNSDGELVFSLRETLAGIRKSLGKIGIRTLLVEFQVCRQQELLSGNTLDEQLRSYERDYLSDREYRQKILQLYPELEKSCEIVLRQQCDFAGQVMQRFWRDQKEIETALLGGRRIRGKLTLLLGEGDAHDKGTAVAQIRFEDGESIFYKPRSLRGDRLFYKLQGKVEERMKMERTQEFPYPYLECDGYCWTGKCQHELCLEEEEIAAFYKRLGIQLGVGYLLGTNDLHYENMIAHGAEPVWIDLETLFGNAGEREPSVLTSGLLPSALSERRFSAVMGGRKSCKAPWQVPVVKKGKQGLCVEYKIPVLKKGKNYPGEELSIQNYEQEILQGFCGAYHYLSELSEEDLTALLEKEISSRQLLGSTQLYQMILEASYHPSVLMKNGGRQEFIQRVCKDHKGCQREQAVLLEGNVPSFYRKSSSTSLFYAGGGEEKNYFEETALEEIRKRHARLCPADQKLQTERIRLSLAMEKIGAEQMKNTLLRAKTGKKEKPWEEHALKIAEKIAEALVIKSDGITEAVCLKEQSGTEADLRISGMDLSFYNGKAGMAVFLRVVNLYCGEYGEVCDILEQELFEYTESVADGKQKAAFTDTGILCGEASLLYAYQLLYGMTGQTKYLRQAERHEEIVAQMLKEDRQYDLTYGNAGAILAFCNQYRLTGQKRSLQWAEQAAELLLEAGKDQDGELWWEAKRYPERCGGAAHGGSGYLLCFERLSECEGGQGRRSIMDKIRKHEERIYELADRGEKGLEREVLPSWCHGCLGRCLLDQETDPAEAERIVRKAELRRSMSLCHGNIGNLLMVKELAKRQSGLEQRALRFEQKVNVMLTEKGVLLAGEKYSYGMMDGLAGIGYGCLKLSGKIRLPEVLLLEIS